MSTANIQVDLDEKIAALAERQPGIDPKDITDIVASVMSSLEGDLSAVNLKLYSEIESLSQFIEVARREIASLSPEEITDEHLPTATDELEAIVGATEKATETIFESVETIESLTERMDAEVAEKITDAVTQVYEACSFQDITGQRISKVVSALKQIESNVVAILEAFTPVSQEDGEARRAAAKAKKSEVPQTDADLMNGPQLPDDANSQEAIDALLASFD